MPKIELLNQEGKSLRTVDLNEAVFGIEPNSQAVFDAVVMQQASMRQGTHSTKTQSQVRGGKAKPWRQKGTGRARAGGTRLPHWRGGGVVFGPTPRKYGYNLNRKVRRLALNSALSQKVIDDGLLLLDNLNFENVKTKEFIKVMDALNLDRRTLFVIGNEEEIDNAYLSMRNLSNVHLLTVERLNTYDVVNAKHVVFTEQAAVEAGEVLA